jgi:hypothetical protein
MKRIPLTALALIPLTAPVCARDLSAGWFVYFRIYGPQPPAFDGSWKPSDFERVA